MEILVLVVYLMFFVMGDFIGQQAVKTNAELAELKTNMCFTLALLIFIFTTLVLSVSFNDINNKTIAFLMIGLGIGFEKGRGKFDDFSWLKKENNK